MKAAKRIGTIKTNAQAKLKQKQTNSLQAYPKNSRPLSFLQRFDDSKMNPKDEVEAKEKISDDEHDEVVLVTRHRKDNNVTVRYLKPTSSSKGGDWGYRTTHTQTFPAEATVEELIEAKPRQNTSVFREYSSRTGKTRALRP